MSLSKKIEVAPSVSVRYFIFNTYVFFLVRIFAVSSFASLHDELKIEKKKGLIMNNNNKIIIIIIIIIVIIIIIIIRNLYSAKTINNIQKRFT